MRSWEAPPPLDAELFWEAPPYLDADDWEVPPSLDADDSGEAPPYRAARWSDNDHLGGDPPRGTLEIEFVAYVADGYIEEEDDDKG